MDLRPARRRTSSPTEPIPPFVQWPPKCSRKATLWQTLLTARLVSRAHAEAGERFCDARVPQKVQMRIQWTFIPSERNARCAWHYTPVKGDVIVLRGIQQFRSLACSRETRGMLHSTSCTYLFLFIDRSSEDILRHRLQDLSLPWNKMTIEPKTGVLPTSSRSWSVSGPHVDREMWSRSHMESPALPSAAAREELQRCTLAVGNTGGIRRTYVPKLPEN